MIDPATEARTAELLEQRRLAPLSAPEARELDAILGAHPELRALADELDRQDAAMNAAIQTAVDHFDFDKALLAAEAQRRLARVHLRFFCLIGAGALAAGAAGAALGFTGWPVVVSMGAAWLVPLLVILLAARNRAARAARIASGDPAAARAAFDEHLHAGRQERTVMQALGVVVGLALCVTIAASLADGAYWRAAAMAAALPLVFHGIWNRYGSRRARRRHERLLAGDLDATAWLSGEDRGA